MALAAGLVVAGFAWAAPKDLQSKLPGKGKIGWQFEKMDEGKFWNPVDAKTQPTQVLLTFRLEAASKDGRITIRTNMGNLKPLTYTFQDAGGKALAKGNLTFVTADGKPPSTFKAATLDVKTGDKVLALLTLPKAPIMAQTKSVVIGPPAESFVTDATKVTFYVKDGNITAPTPVEDETRKRFLAVDQ